MRTTIAVHLDVQISKTNKNDNKNGRNKRVNTEIERKNGKRKL